MIVGTNGGAVFALKPTTGATVWTRAFANGAMRQLDLLPLGVRLYFTTDYRSGDPVERRHRQRLVGRRPDLADPADAALRNHPHLPRRLRRRGLHQRPGDRARPANSWATPKTLDLAGLGGLGPVTIDRSQDLLHAGSRSGRVVAVEMPLP